MFQVRDIDDAISAFQHCHEATIADLEDTVTDLREKIGQLKEDLDEAYDLIEELQEVPYNED